MVQGPDGVHERAVAAVVKEEDVAGGGAVDHGGEGAADVGAGGEEVGGVGDGVVGEEEDVVWGEGESGEKEMAHGAGVIDATAELETGVLVVASHQDSQSLLLLLRLAAVHVSTTCELPVQKCCQFCEIYSERKKSY